MAYLNRVTLEDKQTESEMRLFSIPSDILLWVQNKRESPAHTHTHTHSHSLREWVWLKVQTEFKTCHSTKGLSSEVTSAPQRLTAFCFRFCGGVYVRVPLHNWKVFSLCVSALIREERRAVKWQRGNLHACRCMCVSHLGESLFAYFLWLWLFNVVLMVCFSLAGGVFTSCQLL